MAIEIYGTPAHSWLKGQGKPIFIKFYRKVEHKDIIVQVCADDGVVDIGAHLFKIAPNGDITLFTGIKRIEGLHLTSSDRTLYLTEPN